jgi:hypothetical protein
MSRYELASADNTITLFAVYELKKLRKKYPIHEEYGISAAGIRSRRREVEEAERYFELSEDPDSDWNIVRRRFLEAPDSLKSVLEEHRERGRR